MTCKEESVVIARLVYKLEAKPGGDTSPEANGAIVRGLHRRLWWEDAQHIEAHVIQCRNQRLTNPEKG